MPAITGILKSIKRKRTKLDRLRKMVAALEAELAQIEDAVSGESGSRQRSVGPRLKGRKTEARIKPGSAADVAQAIIRSAGRDLTADEIVERLQQGGKDIDKASVVSSLSRYVNRGQIFTRPKANTYGLLEFEEGRR